MENGHTTIKSGHYLYRIAKQLQKTKNAAAMSVISDTNIRRKMSRSHLSAQIDNAIEHILDSAKYTEQNMLAVQDPYGFAPLTVMLIFNTEKPQKVRVSLIDDTPYTFTTDSEKRHRIPVFFMHPAKKTDILVEILDEDTVVQRTTFTIYNKKLPKMLTNMITIKKKTKPGAAPFLLVYGGDTRFPYVFDEKGEIRYYLNDCPKAYGLFPLSKGRFLFLVKDISAPSFANPHAVLGYEMDFMGRVFREYYVPAGIHHDGCEMTEGGNLLAASSSLTDWVEDAVIEIDRNTGMVVKKLNLADIISDHPYMDYFDWAHINTVSYLQEENAILVCMRNLHTVMKVDWDTHEILWLFCDPAFWKGTPYEKYVLRPEGNIAYSYQAHASYLLPDRTEDGKRQLIIYDNHWHKRRPVKNFDGDKKSYVRIYVIDEENNRVALQKSYGSAKSKIRSNGVICGKHVYSMSGYLNKPAEGCQAMISEFNKETGKLLNRYLTYNSFFRAWPFWLDCKEASRPMTDNTEHVLGLLPEFIPCEKSVLENAKTLPRLRLPKFQKPTDRIIRKEERIREYRENENNTPQKTELSDLRIRLYDDLLLVYGKDHKVQRVFLKGSDHCYVRDFTDTEQRSPALFARYIYAVAIPVCGIKPGRYEIYTEYDGQLYKTEKYLNHKKNTN